MKRKKIVVLGSTGSIGKQALEVISADPERFELLGIAGGGNVSLLTEQIDKYKPKYACAFSALEINRSETKLFQSGEQGTLRMASLEEADVVVNGISGFSALKPLLESLKAGKRVALANKESIVCGKTIVDTYIKQYGGEILPVDSEQSALFQCMQSGNNSEIQSLILTCSGGRFWRNTAEEIENITPEQALNHPTWNMGQKITIDSATLFNKGLEVIEASYLFDIPGNCIEVLIHPQSIVHSMVGFCDGTVIANMSNPDMRLPIQYAMTYPDRSVSVCQKLSLGDIRSLEFYDAKPERYPALRMAYDALEIGGTMTTVYNAANEAAVELFRKGIISFGEIYRAVDYVMEQHAVCSADSIEVICSADREARNAVYKKYTM